MSNVECAPVCLACKIVKMTAELAGLPCDPAAIGG